MADYRYNNGLWHGPSPSAFARNGPYSSFPSSDSRDSQSWKDSFASRPYGGNGGTAHGVNFEDRFAGLPAGNYGDGPSYVGGRPIVANCNGPFFGADRADNAYDGLRFDGGPPFDDRPYGEHTVSWNDRASIRQHGSFADDTWRCQTSDTWRDDPRNRYENAGRTNCGLRYRRRSRSPPTRMGRTFPRKSEFCRERSPTRRYHSSQERSRYSGSAERGETSSRTTGAAARPASREVEKSESKKSEIKKDETESNAKVKEHRSDEQKECVGEESGRKDETNASKQLETAEEQQKSNEKQSSGSGNKGNDSCNSKGGNDETGNELKIRSDLTHDEIHHFKPIVLQDRSVAVTVAGGHPNSADSTTTTTTISQKESFRKYVEAALKQKCLNSPDRNTEKRATPSPLVTDGSSPQRIRSPILDPQKYVEELSNPDTDPPGLDDLANDLLPKTITSHNGGSSHKRPLISEHPYPSRKAAPFASGGIGDKFGGFFSGPVIAGPSKMHVRRTLVSSPPPYDEPERPFKPGLLDPPPTKRPYDEPPYCMRAPSPQRPVKPGLLDGPPMGPPKMQERPRNGPAVNPTISAVAESITAVATSLAPPEIIAAVTEKGLADELLSNENLKAKIKEVYAEEIQKILAKKSEEQHASIKEPERSGGGGGYHDEKYRNLPHLSGAVKSDRDEYDDGSSSACHREPRDDPQNATRFFKYNGPEWRMNHEDESRFGADSKKTIKLMDSSCRSGNSKYHDGPSVDDYAACEDDGYRRRSDAKRFVSTANYEGESYGPPSDRFAQYAQEPRIGSASGRCSYPLERYSSPPDRCGNPSDRYGGPPDRYGGPPDRYNGPAPDRFNRPFHEDKHFISPRNQARPSTGYRGFGGQRNYY